MVFVCPVIGKSLEEVIDAGMQHSAYNPWSLLTSLSPKNVQIAYSIFERQVNNLTAISEANEVNVVI